MAVNELEKQTNLKETLLDVLTVVARRRWWILSTICCVALTTLTVVLLLPDRYASEAILVRHQPVSQGYALGASAMLTNDEAVEASTREVLSRPQLLAIVREFDLYANMRRKGTTAEGLIGVMRHDITIEPLDPTKPLGESSPFKISFAAEQPKIAQGVVTKLVQVFIDANVKIRENKAEATTTFLKEQVEAARGRLTQQEQRLRDFKAQHSGELPEQQPVNSAAATELRSQWQSTVNNLDRAKQQRSALESSLSGNLGRLRSDRSTLLARYTSRHPEVLKNEKEIARIEAALSRLRSGSTTGDSPPSLARPEDPMMMEAVKQADINRREVESLVREEARLRSSLGQYQGRLNSTPLREQQLSGLLRDYDLSREDYTTLLNRQLHSELAGNLEERGEGAQFRLVDPPSLPITPSSPQRIKICLGGVGGGILLGMALAFLLHFLDGSLNSEKSVKQRFALPIVVGVPLMLTPAEVRSRIWGRRLEWLAGSAMTLAVLAAEVYVLRRG